MRLDQTTLNAIAMGVSAFFVSWARYLAQYGYAPWKSGVSSLFTAWIIHYFALAFVCIGVILVKYYTDKFLLPNVPKGRSLSDIEMSGTIIFVAQVSFVAAVIFIALSIMGPFSPDVID